MNLKIDIDAVTRVLVGGQWFDVHRDDDSNESTFDLDDSYQFVDSRPRNPLGGRHVGKTTPSLGFKFKDKATGNWVYGPLTALRAVVEDQRLADYLSFLQEAEARDRRT
jgi:hypothetical protein